MAKLIETICLLAIVVVTAIISCAEASCPCSCPKTTTSYPCMCPMDLSLVCCNDKNTYSNLCTACCEKTHRNANLKVDSKGQCTNKANAAACTAIYKPVCDSKGQTHPNLCELQRDPCYDGKYKNGACCKSKPKWIENSLYSMSNCNCLWSNCE